MGTLVEYAYSGLDNEIDLELREDGVAQNISALTRVTLNLKPREGGGALILVDSSLQPLVFDWSSLGLSGVLKILFGKLSVPLPEGDYDTR
ncbi:unnamed protein product, partial [marine sediment metagenome]